MLFLFACNEECFQFGREGHPLPNILCETRRARATYARLYFFSLSIFSGHDYIVAHWQWLLCWEVMPLLTLPIVVSYYFTSSGE